MKPHHVELYHSQVFSRIFSPKIPYFLHFYLLAGKKSFLPLVTV